MKTIDTIVKVMEAVLEASPGEFSSVGINISVEMAEEGGLLETRELADESGGWRSRETGNVMITQQRIHPKPEHLNEKGQEILEQLGYLPCRFDVSTSLKGKHFEVFARG